MAARNDQARWKRMQIYWEDYLMSQPHELEDKKERERRMPRRPDPSELNPIHNIDAAKALEIGPASNKVLAIQFGYDTIASLSLSHMYDIINVAHGIVEMDARIRALEEALRVVLEMTEGKYSFLELMGALRKVHAVLKDA